MKNKKNKKTRGIKEKVCLSCRVRFQHKKLPNGAPLDCPYCNQTFLIKDGQLTYRSLPIYSQHTADFFAEGARKKIEEEGEVAPPRTYSKSELAELNKKGPSDFKCVFCGSEGGKIAEMKQFGMDDVSGLLPEDTRIVSCPKCEKSHITNGKRIYVNQTKENGYVVDNFVARMKEHGVEF
ncbi:MAG: hypothetical protein GPJ51_14760 [Candidatus Heimdallarchaeota archaeon]|nr:hypothetical protein [Candidatus Heimdallarchaeota archaeon]